MPSLGPILAVTVAVPDLDRAAAAYRALLGHVELAAGGEPGSRWRVLGPRGARWGLIRLRERRGGERPPTFRTLGWTALEILVADADAMYERCLSVPGFDVLQAPVAVGAGGALRALQAAGPGGEGVYLTQVVRASELFELPALEKGEHRVYVAVCGTRDLPAVRERFAGYGAQPVTDHELPIRVLNQAYGLPAGTLHRLSSVQLAGDTVIEIDQYPAEAAERSAEATGITSVTFAGTRPAAEAARPLPASAAPPYWGAAAWEVAGEHGLRFEVVER